MALHPTSGAIVSADARGIVEYWLPTQGGAFPKSATKFTSKFTTDLFKLARKKIRPRAVAMAPNGNYFALSCGDGKVRLYHFRTGKLRRVFEEVTEEQAAAIAEEQEGASEGDDAYVTAQRRQAMEEDLKTADGSTSAADLPRPCSANLVFVNRKVSALPQRRHQGSRFGVRNVVPLLSEFEERRDLYSLRIQGTRK